MQGCETSLITLNICIHTSHNLFQNFSKENFPWHDYRASETMLSRCEMESQNLHLALSGLVSVGASTLSSYLCDGLASKAQRGTQTFVQVVFPGIFYPRPVDDVYYIKLG